ncbi:MAG: hypothetical protein KAY24_00600, partial [Candidatus Eisenbacteria sp.]|nr:hypothetical protein [Candidatus Eisenbacteria bacterium]
GNLALVYLVLLLVVTPWTLRNARVFGGFVPVSNNGGINLLIGNGTGANGQYRENALPPGEGRLLGEYEKGRLAARLAAQSILGDPMRFVRLVPQKVLRMYADDAQAIRWNLKGMSGRASNGRYGFWDYAAMAVVQAYYGLVLLAFVACLISSYSAKRFRERIHPLGLSLVLYFTVVAIVFFGDPRFHFPLVPVFCLYAAQMLFSRSCGDDQAFSETTSA